MIVISERFADVYISDRGISPDRVHVIPNWVDQVISTHRHGQVGRMDVFIREKLAIPATAFLMIYAGNIGAAAGMETLILAMDRLRERTDVYLLIAGEGNHISAVQSQVERLSLERVKFYSPWPVSETSQLLSSADLLLLPTKGSQSLVSVPSKLVLYMFAGRPVLAQVQAESDTAQIIRRAGCGWVLAPDEPDLLAGTIDEVIRLPEAARHLMGMKGYQYAFQHFSESQCLPRVMRVIERAANKTCSQPAETGHTEGSS